MPAARTYSSPSQPLPATLAHPAAAVNRQPPLPLNPPDLLVWMPPNNPASDMNDDMETTAAAAPTPPGPTPGPRRPAPLTPPPDSAPGEFLAAQNPPDDAAPADADAATAPLTPPPPSAPAEFLDAQHPAGEAPAQTPAALLAAYLAAEPPQRWESGIWPLTPPEVPSPPPAAAVKSQSEMYQPASIRSVPMMLGEEVAWALLPNDGLSPTLPDKGQALILTNQRLIVFRGIEGYRDTHIAAPAELTQFSVRTGQRNWRSIGQGFTLMAAGVLLYLVLSYWLTGVIRGPNIPGLNMDLAPLIALLVVFAGLMIFLQNYFTRPTGAIIFRGPGVEIAFPFRSTLDLRQVYYFVDLVRAASGHDLVETPPDDP